MFFEDTPSRGGRDLRRSSRRVSWRIGNPAALRHRRQRLPVMARCCGASCVCGEDRRQESSDAHDFWRLMLGNRALCRGGAYRHDFLLRAAVSCRCDPPVCISDKIILRGAPNFLCEVLHTRPKTESYKNLAIFSRPPDPSCCGAGYRKEQRGFDDVVGSLSEQQNLGDRHGNQHLGNPRRLRSVRRHGSHQLYVRRNLIGFSATPRTLFPSQELRPGCFLSSEAGRVVSV